MVRNYALRESAGNFTPRDTLRHRDDGKAESLFGDSSSNGNRGNEQSSQPSVINAVLGEHLRKPPIHYAFVAVADDGEVNITTSDSLKPFSKRLFSSTFMNHLEHVVRGRSSQEGIFQQAIRSSGLSGDAESDSASPDGAPWNSSSTDSSSMTPRVGNVKLEKLESDDDIMVNRKSRKRARIQRFTPSYITQSSVESNQTRQLVIGDSQKVAQLYSDRFKDLQQNACKSVAKAFVKVMEPKKQTNHPYTKKDESAPKWWPLASVEHREPDHLLKSPRIILLVHILQVVVSQEYEKSDHLKTVTIELLQKETEKAMMSWFDDPQHPNNAKKRPFLTEIFRVAKLEERYRKGELDGSATVTVIGSEKTAQMASDDEVYDERLRYEGEEQMNNEASGSQIMSPDASPRSGHPQAHLQHRPESATSDAFGYSSMRDLPLRSYSTHYPEEHQVYSENNQHLNMSNQSCYVSRPPSAGFQQGLGIHDHHNRLPWQSNEYNGWSSNNNMGHNPSLSFIPLGISSPASGPQSTPYLPPPLSTPNVLPPMPQQHQLYNDGLPKGSFDGTPPLANIMRTGSLGHPHQISQHHGFQDYLHDAGYPSQSENERSA